METRDTAYFRARLNMAWVLLLIAILSGCSKSFGSFVKDTRRGATGLEANEGITVILDNQAEFYSPGDAAALEKTIGQCIADAIKKIRPTARFVDPGDFKRVALPGEAARFARERPDTILSYLDRPQFSDAVKAFNLRYFIYIRESTLKYGTDGYIGDPLAMGIVYKKRTLLSADVIDLRKACYCGTIESTVEANGFGGVVMIMIPMYIPAMTESKACDNLGTRVAEFILKEDSGVTREGRSTNEEPESNIINIIPDAQPDGAPEKRLEPQEKQTNPGDDDYVPR